VWDQIEKKDQVEQDLSVSANEGFVNMDNDSLLKVVTFLLIIVMDLWCVNVLVGVKHSQNMGWRFSQNFNILFACFNSYAAAFCNGL
jgi:hypothetical protein